jgi:hypothetical protein
MCSSFTIPVSFGESEINDVDNACFFTTSVHKIVCFDISMHKTFTMDLLQTGYQLDSDTKDTTEGKGLAAELGGVTSG